MVTASPQFPIVDALLIQPEEAKNGHIGICTNTTAPGQVMNEIDEALRPSVSVLGSLIVSRDGAERMILNSLAHPTITYLILFSEESLTFSPSTNLLAALQNGIDASNADHPIVNGKAASAHYPNLSERVVNAFRENIVVLPIFMFKNDYSRPILESYLEWLKPQIDPALHTLLVEINNKKSIYYDSLNSLIKLIQSLPRRSKDVVDLDPKEFRHLQPPKVFLEDTILNSEVPFSVKAINGRIRVDLKLGEDTFYIEGADEFPLEYSLMKGIGEKKKLLSPLDQLLLGAEISRVSTEIRNKMEFPPFAKHTDIVGKVEIPHEPKVSLITDKRFYYKIGVKEKQVSVMCLAFDVCEEVFELRAKSLPAILSWLAEKNRFEEYEMDILHRMDVAGQISRASIAAALDYAFIQDFASIFKINTEHLPFLLVESDTFLDVHKRALMRIYTEGLTEEHGDKQKGAARTGVVLAVYRNTERSLASLPALYKQGDRETTEIRKAYKEQLLRFDHDGDYSYGQRTRAFFGFDQLPATGEALRNNPARAAIIQRYDPSRDMGSYVEPETGKKKYTHDPCLTHDIFFIQEDTLHSLHMARAHNMVNAYPENIFGLYDAYVCSIRDTLQTKPGDMYMLSSRGNILLLTEEQRTKKILGEPSKPQDDNASASGPYNIGEGTASHAHTGLSYAVFPLQEVSARPASSIIDRLENFEGVNTIERAINYLKEKGVMHNNPVLTEYQAGKMDPQGDYLAFFQANVFGKKVYATAVFMNHTINLPKDQEVLNYLGTRFSKELGYPLGELVLIYV